MQLYNWLGMNRHYSAGALGWRLLRSPWVRRHPELVMGSKNSDEIHESWVEYYFEETSGNPGGSDSGWQTSASYTDSGLTASTQYTYTVRMRDSATPTPNVGTASSPANATTDAEAGDVVTIIKAEFNINFII